MWVGISVLIWGVVLGIAVLALLAIAVGALINPRTVPMKPFLSGFQYVYFAYVYVGLFLGLALFLYIPIADYFGLTLQLVGGSLNKTLLLLMVAAFPVSVVMYLYMLCTPWSQKESLVFGFSGRTIVLWAIVFLPWIWIQALEAMEWADPKRHEVMGLQFTKENIGLADLAILLGGSGLLTAVYCLVVGIFGAISLAVCFPLSRPLFGLVFIKENAVVTTFYYVFWLGGACAVIWFYMWPDLVQYYEGPYAWLNQYL